MQFEVTSFTRTYLNCISFNVSFKRFVKAAYIAARKCNNATLSFSRPCNVIKKRYPACKFLVTVSLQQKPFNCTRSTFSIYV